MRVRVELKTDKPLALDIAYNHIIQAFVYRNLSEKTSKFIHDEGYKYNGKTFKMFTFSKIRYNGKTGKKDFRSKKIIFYDTFFFCISSPNNEFIDELIQHFFKNQLIIGGRPVTVKGVDVFNYNELDKYIINDKMIVKTISPVFVHSTNDDDFDYHLPPTDERFPELVKNNIINKYWAFYRKAPEDDRFEIKLINKNQMKGIKDFYKKDSKNPYRCHYAQFEITGSKELLRFAYDVGIGSRNSQGYGCIEVLGL